MESKGDVLAGQKTEKQKKKDKRVQLCLSLYKERLGVNMGRFVVDRSTFRLFCTNLRLRT